MVRSGEALRTLGGVAAAQWGLVTATQARRSGLTAQQLARLANEAALERVRHGVYRVSGSPPHEFDELRAAWLSLDPERLAYERLTDGVAVVSHRTATALHGLGDVEADVLEFTVRDRKQSRDRQLKFHRGRLEPSEWTLVDGLPVTTVITTVRDLAASRLDGGHLAAVVRDAVTTHHVDLDAVSEVLAEHAHVYGAPLGDGMTLVQRFLEQAGVPASTTAAAELVHRDVGTVRVPASLFAELQRPGGLLSEETRRALAAVSKAQLRNERQMSQLAEFVAAAAPAARLAEQAQRLFQASGRWPPRRGGYGGSSPGTSGSPGTPDDEGVADRS